MKKGDFVEATVYDFERLLDKQTNKGIAEYGHTLDESDLGVKTLLEMCREEIVDAFAYLNSAIEKLEKLEKDLLNG